MKILIIEDDPGTREQLTAYLCELSVSPECILVAKDMAEFLDMFGPEIGLCIIDLRLPAYEGANQDNNEIGVLQAIDRAGADRTKMVAISAYPEEFETIRPQFERRGCLLLDFKQPDVWKSVLKQMVLELQTIESMDFLIFCALLAERAPYTGMPALAGVPKSKDNFTRYDISIAGMAGTIIELPRMGLVDAAITAGLCIEKFKPHVVAMSGICAGFPVVRSSANCSWPSSPMGTNRANGAATAFRRNPIRYRFPSRCGCSRANSSKTTHCFLG